MAIITAMIIIIIIDDNGIIVIKIGRRSGNRGGGDSEKGTRAIRGRAWTDGRGRRRERARMGK